MEKIKKHINIKLISFVAVTVILLIYSAIVNVTEYTHDCLGYWKTADTMWTYGEGSIITLTNFPETFRGYFLYFVVMLFKHAFGIVFGNGYWGWRFLSAISTSAAVTLALPYFFDVEHDKKRLFIGQAVLLVLILYFWGDLIQKPGSDWIAACFFIYAVAFLKKMFLEEKKWLSCIYGLIVGACMYAAYNTRVVYMYAIIIALFCMLVYEGKRKFTGIVAYVGIFLGMLIIAFPQMTINHKYTGEWSPFVNTDQAYNYQVDLESKQLYWGLYLPRYETYDGDYELYPEAGVHFEDKVGLELIEREGLDSDHISFKTILYLFVKYPGDVIGLYMRHMASVMVPMWYKNCIIDMYTSKLIRITLAIWIWIIAAVAFLENYKFEKKDIMKYVLTISMIITSLMQCAGAIEIRFMIMCFMLLYYYITCMVDYKALWESLKGRRIKILLVGLVVYFLWLTVLGDILTMPVHKVLLISDYLG